jgi:chromosome segregation ATPase
MMAIPAVVQGTVELDGKVFELDSPKGSRWLESVTSFRFEPRGANKPYTVRKESGKGSNYWYGYRKVAGKLHKKYIGKSSEVSTTKLEEIAKALNTPPQPRVTRKVTEVTEANSYGVTDIVTDNYAADRLTALELQVQALQESLEALREALPGKSEGLSDSPELLKLEVTDTELQIELGNLKVESENLRQRLAESQDTIETLNWGTEALNERLAVANQAIIEQDDSIESLRQELTENTRYYTARLNEAGATIGTFKDKLEVAQAKNQRLQNNLGNLQAEREELAQLKKEVKEHAAEVHREGRSIELEKDRWQGQLSDARAELADAQAIIVNQGNRIRELERGYTLKPNPAERRLRLEIGELQTQLSELKQKSATASELPEAAYLLNQLKSKRKKSTTTLADIEAILEMIEE